MKSHYPHTHTHTHTHKHKLHGSGNPSEKKMLDDKNYRTRTICRTVLRTVANYFRPNVRCLRQIWA